MSSQAQLLPGTLDLLILRTLLAGPTHGHAIAKHIQQTSEDLLRVETGSLYPALHRLEYRGFLIADWKQTETGREARFYRLTRKGRAHLETESASWERLAEAVGLILRMSQEGAP